ncbi:D-lactate dehydrogenase (cytochrome) [Sphingomonas vulcanisoli]|uniref:D-lactate dehydrogenase (cytochrome) n=1 Tax=Sphingomonas vulcanisoli TaxID=1658060 RepID=A0ABX0TSR4_9SPHN|nr:FAD-binding oxidoreductase [Sphingomonas vulcanisoli]NIJ08557.1 D-lactate dehydrogenase (cytochrome) [Sphingomonas vulcanisoli]
MLTRTTTTSLIDRLRDAVGGAGVSDAIEHRALMGTDVYRGGGSPAIVVRPADVAALQAAVRICAEAGVAMVPRGGGASYTDGYLLAGGGHVLIDTGALDSIHIDKTNATVTVGAGVTWAAMREALTPHGLRTPFWGPFSGLVATVGGSVSQNALSHGSGAHGISAQSVLSIDVVLASGDLMRTGASEVIRNYGPDLTGLFCGDCGALGIKAAVTLPLIAVQSASADISFAFADFAAFAEAGRLVQLEGLDDEHFGLDIALSQGQIARQEGAGAKLRAAGQILRAAPNKLAGLVQLARMGIAGANVAASDAYMWHFMIDGVDATEAGAKAKRLRAILSRFGREITNSVPSYVRAVPFAALFNILGPKGERWVPIHGVLPQTQVLPFHAALTKLFAERKAEMNRLGVWVGTMFSPVGSTGFLYELAFYWPDARTTFHDTILDPAHLAKIPAYPAAPEAAAFTDQLKRDAIALYAAHDAAHFQIGRAYPYRDRLNPAALALLRAVKAQLDPQGLMNPGVLGL